MSSFGSHPYDCVVGPGAHQHCLEGVPGVHREATWPCSLRLTDANELAPERAPR